MVVIGGGLGGCAAALTAQRAGVEVEILERMDSLAGVASWTGQLLTWILRQEAKLMGGGAADIVHLMESLAIHVTPEFDVPKGNVTFDVTRIEAGLRHLVEGAAIKVRYRSRVVDVEMEGNKMVAALLEDGTKIKGDAFVDATGRTGGVEWCEKLGQGCVQCMLKCTVFGDRVPISTKAGVPDREEKWNYFPMPLIAMESLSSEVRNKIEGTPEGYSYHPIPGELLERDFTNDWRRPDRPVTKRIKSNVPGMLEVVHVPFAKCTLNLPLKYWRQIPGFENAWLVQPLSADGETVGTGFCAQREKTMRVTGLANLFAGGLRSGRYTAFVEVMMAGDLAGHNAARHARGKDLVSYPSSTLVGFFLNEINTECTPNEWHGPLLDDTRYYAKGFSTTDYGEIRERVVASGWLGALGRKLA
ncbi:MAG: FAD-dependent oxidoreductase [Chloroflexi bacterium]|nr:FAD-dependent oxidoreductase [Chloroflexota bacterium]